MFILVSGSVNKIIHSKFTMEVRKNRMVIGHQPRKGVVHCSMLLLLKACNISCTTTIIRHYTLITEQKVSILCTDKLFSSVTALDESLFGRVYFGVQKPVNKFPMVQQKAPVPLCRVRI